MLYVHLLGFQAINSQKWGNICGNLSGLHWSMWYFKSYKEKKERNYWGENMCGIYGFTTEDTVDVQAEKWGQ